MIKYARDDDDNSNSNDGDRYDDDMIKILIVKLIKMMIMVTMMEMMITIEMMMTTIVEMVVLMTIELMMITAMMGMMKIRMMKMMPKANTTQPTSDTFITSMSPTCNISIVSTTIFKSLLYSLPLRYVIINSLSTMYTNR